MHSVLLRGMSHEIGDAEMESSDDGSVFLENNDGTDVFVTFEDGDPVHVDLVDTGFRFVTPVVFNTLHAVALNAHLEAYAGHLLELWSRLEHMHTVCLLYTSDAADE